MRPLLLCALAALTTIATVAAAEEPINLPNPPDLPDIGSPASALLSGSDEYQLGAMVIHQLRDQNAILEDPSSRALYLFPTKALAQDQLAELQAMCEQLGWGAH